MLTKGNNYSEPAHTNVDKNVPPTDEGQVNSDPGYTMSDQSVHTSNEELQDGRQHPEPEQIGSSCNYLFKYRSFTVLESVEQL